jgi:hypothetical protein
MKVAECRTKGKLPEREACRNGMALLQRLELS